ncbi:brefeldin A-inhibited guanine nucleotide-exchange protein 3 isoform X2 [Agrilus planipennis]|uniref:Brefeldin A-inhibited guanine nucleotide-exchange protein 3 isoform X2 n=1 Tax=Agrilus planipennis TaxID=224129 RepID=A0A7F5RKE2_AGRPL|nr:brefeldin A-inhibited guanine nucleotide-exchange protein 3 isoform X2 [Agrilus planipennis]
MEDLLQNLIKEASGPRLSSIRQSAQEAHDLLTSQNNLLRNPSFELRAACFNSFRHAFETKRSKLVTMAITGFNKIVRDDRFQIGTEPEDDSLWLPAQLLNATTTILTHCEDTQVHVLRVFLNMACGTSLALNGRLVILLINRFGEAYENGTQPIRAAAQAAASQTLTAFCAFLDEECQEILSQQQKHKNSGSSAEMVYSKTSAVACFNEAIPVMQYISSRLEETKILPKPNDITVFLLECLLTLVNTLPQTVHSNLHFTTFLWQRFCPSLLSLLGTPGDPESRSLTTQQAKIVYSIGIQVVRLVGRERHLRPVLEALFHRMLLLPTPGKRLEPLRAAKELLRSPARLADLLLLSGPIHRHAGDDMAIIRLIMDSIEESSQHNDPAIMLASVECVRALLGSLEALCKGEGLDMEGSEMANSRYPTLEQADYTGPLTYQSLARLPKPYRDVVANLKYHNDSDSSGVEGGGQIVEGETDSDCSGVTEGPEEFGVHSDDSNTDDENYSANHEIKKLHNLPKALQLGRNGIDECNVDLERHNARHFVKTLQNILLPSLLSLRSSIQIDEYMQEFASKCCQHNSSQNYEISTIMNADGVYLATYSALLLNLKLIQIGHYEERNGEALVPMSEAQFVEEIHGSGILVYVSATWLCELYQNVIAKPLLLTAGYDPKSPNQPALINLLNDVGGMSPSQLLSDWQKLQKVRGTPDISPEVEAGTKLSRRVLTCCWGSVVSVLGSALGEKPPPGGTSALSRLVARRARQKLRQRIKDDVISASLEGLHKAASLSNTLKLQSRSSSILALLASSSCKNQGPKILASHALSLDVLLSKGLALGSHSSLCWPHVFNACVAVAALEHALFSKAGSTQLLMVAQNPQNNVVTSTTAINTCEKLNMSYNVSSDDETCVDVYSFLQNTTNLSGSNTDASVAEIVERSGVHNTQGPGILTGVNAAKVCCVLSTRADELFHSAALRLALPGLCSFLNELCKASYAQLFAKFDELPKKPKKWWKKELESYQKPPATLLLHRIGEVTLKCIRSGRPLIHTMKVWSIVGPHFMQAACHKDRAVSKKAVTCIHDAVTALLNEQTELPHFHFNEALFKPFENLLCLELCDTDVQDQIVSCLCEFVEGNRTEISSGWRPLFGTLRVANSRQNAAAILEVFKVFLQTDNTLVFANAALDYILCLLSHIRNSDSDDSSVENLPSTKIVKNTKNVKIQEQQKISFLDSFDLRSKDNSFVSKEVTSTSDLCLESLKLLQNCATILSMMYHMPKCPTFNLTHRMNIDTEPQLVDPIIQNSDIITFSQTELEPPSYKLLSLQQDLENCDRDGITLPKMDKASGVLKVWYVLLEGLTSASVISSHKNQPYILETLFKLLKDLIVNPGVDFGFYCINHLLLPMVQNWLRQNCKVPKTTDIGQNFKHCCGMASELIVEYLHHLQGEKENEHESLQNLLRKEHPGATLALKQLLLILIECISQPNENIARLGTSCMRHIILNVGQILNSHQWEILVTGVHRACEISLHPLQQITLAFKPHSDSFYGDLATVKVAARKDSTVKENERVYELARQVFLMQNQKSCNKCTGKVCECDKTTSSFVIDDRSYVFLLYPLDMASSLNPDLYTLRVPFKNLVVGILAHQMLIQTISSALLQNLNHVTPILNILQVNSCSLRGILTHVNAKHIDTLLKCLELSSERARDFDIRPGLKFLTQKVGNLNKAANLYTQSNTSEVVQIIVLIELCLDGIEKYNITPNGIKEILAKDDKQRCSTDLKYVEKFLRNLQTKWEFLCESYVNLRINIPDERSECASELSTSEEVLNNGVNEDAVKSEKDQKPKPFKLSDFKRSDSFTSTDSESYLEKSPFTDLKSENKNSKDSDKEDANCKTKLLSKSNCPNSDDDENETSANKATKTNLSHDYKVPTNSIKYDTNTLMQIRATISIENITPKIKDTKRTMSESYDIDKDIEQKVEAMMEQYRKRKTNHYVASTPKTESFNTGGTIIPPQPIPPEIQQQRAISIFKDSEAYRSARIETMEACMELLCSLPSEKLSPLATVLKQGALMLLGAQEEKIQLAAEKLLQRMNISYIEDDNMSV